MKRPVYLSLQKNEHEIYTAKIKYVEVFFLWYISVLKCYWLMCTGGGAN